MAGVQAAVPGALAPARPGADEGRPLSPYAKAHVDGGAPNHEVVDL